MKKQTWCRWKETNQTAAFDHLCLFTETLWTRCRRRRNTPKNYKRKEIKNTRSLSHTVTHWACSIPVNTVHNNIHHSRKKELIIDHWLLILKSVKIAHRKQRGVSLTLGFYFPDRLKCEPLLIDEWFMYWLFLYHLFQKENPETKYQ